MNEQYIYITDYLNMPAQEAFRVLNANLGLNKSNEKFKLISFTSFNPGEGKTSVAINLAIAAAKSGMKVLYIDADLRKPRQLKRRGDDIQKGLTDFCEGTGIQDVICKTVVENLKYVTSGKQLVDPVEFLCSRIFDDFLAGASQMYDMVLLDTPSLGKCVDGAIVASKVSGVLVITSSQKTRYKHIERIKWQMENVGATIIGIVINRVAKRELKSYFILGNNYKYLTKNLKQYKLDT